MPMLRFREKKGTIAGEDREGSDVIREGLLQIYRENGFDPVAAGNSTKGFWRDLKGFEVKAVKLRNTANFAKRAGNRAIPEEQRQENLEKTKASIENGKRKRALENGDNTGYRPRDQGADVEVTGHAPNKRVYKEPVFAPSQIRAPANSVRGNAGESSRQGLRSKASMAVNQQPVTQQRAYQQQAYQQLAYQQQAYQQPEFQQPVHQQLVHQQPQLVMNPYHLNGRPDTQRGPGQSYLGQAPTTSSYVPQHLPHQGMERGSLNMPPPASGQGYGFQSPNNGYALPQTFGKQTQGGLDESEYDPYVIGENRQRIVRQGKIDEFARANMVPKRPMPSTNSGYSVPSHVSNLHPGSAVERQAPFEGTNGAMKPNGNTLGPGGHQTYQAPKQVLGKRRQQGGNVTAPNQYPESRISTTSDRVQQEEVVGQAIPDPQVGPSQKRPRKNETAGPAPKPQHRRRGGKTPQPKRYGPGGAPEPILLPQEPLESLNPTPDIIENAEGRFRSAGEVYEEMAPTFGFDGSGNYYGNNGDMLDQKTVLEFNWDAAGRDLDLDHLQQPRVDEPEPHAYQAPQVEEEDLNPPQQPHMDEPEPNVHQAPEVEDEHPSPPQQPDVDEPEINAHQAPQVEDNHLTPPLLNENDDAPQVADAQGPDPPSGPSPAPADQDAPFDIRDVRPTDGWQSQSLRNALNYTREAYFEWTGNEVPITTNLEHSYNMQYREIELAFENWWTSGDNPDRVEPIPELYRMKA